ncbi:MAG: DinB family protein [Anaerolineaceae bacterium]
MKPLLLIDLDNTLLDNDINFFLGAYLKALGKHLSSRIAPEKMIPLLLAGTEKMIKKEMPAQTLEESFDQAFYPAMGIPKEELAEEIHFFYAEIFPGLKTLTKIRPEAIQIIDFAFENAYPVVIATNPVFPRRAILHRLDWAGVPAEKYHYQLVTSYETFHFAKPNPAYYAEILAQLGWPERPALMIGNSLEDDIIPASQIGIPGFFLTDKPVSLPEGIHPYSSQGSFEHVLYWIKETGERKAEQVPLSATALLSILKSTPAALETLSSNLDEHSWKQKPAADEWCLAEIVAHLRDVDREVNLPRLEKVCQEDNPFLPGVDTDPWANERQYILENGLAARQEFLMVRTKLLEMVCGLSEIGWQRPARHAIFGPTNLTELVAIIATHDQLHIRQSYGAIHNT